MLVSLPKYIRQIDGGSSESNALAHSRLLERASWSEDGGGGGGGAGGGPGVVVLLVVVLVVLVVGVVVRGRLLFGNRDWRASERIWGSSVGGCRVVRMRWWRYLFRRKPRGWG